MSLNFIIAFSEEPSFTYNGELLNDILYSLYSIYIDIPFWDWGILLMRAVPWFFTLAPIFFWYRGRKRLAIIWSVVWLLVLALLVHQLIYD
jgi:hypothetical protein